MALLRLNYCICTNNYGKFIRLFVDQMSVFLERLAKRAEEVYLVGRKRIFDECFRQHSTEVRLYEADYLCLLGVPADMYINDSDYD